MNENRAMDATVLSLVDKVPQWQGREVRTTPLSGGITNQNFRVDVDEESYVLRVLSPTTDHLGIDRDHEVACSRTAAELGVGPEVIHYSLDDGVLVIRFVEAEVVSAERACEPTTLVRIVETIKRIHDGPAFAGSFSAFQTVRDYHALATEHGVCFPRTLPRVLDLMARIEDALAGRQSSRPCHNDLLAANFLDDGERIWIIDWEYGGMGDPFFDLGNFSVNQALGEDQANLLLRNYFGREPSSANTAHLKLMELASDLRESFWGFLQSGVSSLDFDYLAYGEKHLERFLSRASVNSFASWIEELKRG